MSIKKLTKMKHQPNYPPGLEPDRVTFTLGFWDRTDKFYRAPPGCVEAIPKDGTWYWVSKARAP